jgi:hypothetical protein
MDNMVPQQRTEKVNCHIHTTYSDGQHSLGKVINKALKAGLEVLVVADHDTMNAYRSVNHARIEQEVQGNIVWGNNGMFTITRENHTLTVMQGIEFTTRYNSDINGRSTLTTLHILGFPFREEDLQEYEFVFTHLAESKKAQVKKIITNLHTRPRYIDGREFDYSLITFEKAVEAAGVGRVDRTRIAEQIINEFGLEESIKQVIGKHLSADDVYVSEGTVFNSLPTLDTISFILNHGAIPVWVHPKELSIPETMAVFLNHTRGLMGIEYSARPGLEATHKHIEEYRRQGVFVSYGSDFHDRIGDEHELVVKVPEGFIKSIYAHHERIQEEWVRRDA